MKEDNEPLMNSEQQEPGALSRVPGKTCHWQSDFLMKFDIKALMPALQR